ncbi:MAG: porin family protein [Sedimentisphaerales bacterium]|nr:porin family protein [Sedimentisphaerales bacterium]
MKRWLILLSVGCLAFAPVANASVQKGDTTLEALGGWLTQNAKTAGNDIDVWFLTGGIGYFVTDNIEVAGAALWASLEQGTSDLDVWGLGGRAKYHFMPQNQWVPYVGGQVLWASADMGAGADTDGVLWGPVAGARYELNETNDFFVEYQYHLWSGDIGDVIDDGHALLLGIVHQFK